LLSVVIPGSAASIVTPRDLRAGEIAERITEPTRFAATPHNRVLA